MQDHGPRLTRYREDQAHRLAENRPVAYTGALAWRVTSTLVLLGPGTSDTSRENSEPRSTPDQWVLGFFCEGGWLAAAEAAEAGEASASLGASAWPCCKELWQEVCAQQLYRHQRLARFAVGGLGGHGILGTGAPSTTGWGACAGQRVHHRCPRHLLARSSCATPRFGYGDERHGDYYVSCISPPLTCNVELPPSDCC